MHWTDYFDEIFLINLPDRPERLADATTELNKYEIPFKVWDAFKDDNGVYGLNFTMQSLFLHCTENKNKRTLVFEDDVQFVNDPSFFMPKCVEQLQISDNGPLPWEMFYLGLNMDNENNLFPGFVDNNLLAVDFCYATHAVAYTGEAIIKILERLAYQRALVSKFSSNLKPFDQIINETIGLGIRTRLCTYPLLATQADGYSDIEKKNSTFEYIEQRYNNSIKHLLQGKKEIIYTEHLAGDFEDGLQVCRLCGHVICDYTGSWATDDGSTPQGFQSGPIYITGNFPVETTSLKPLPNYANEDPYIRKIVKCDQR